MSTQLSFYEQLNNSRPPYFRASSPKSLAETLTSTRQSKRDLSIFRQDLQSLAKYIREITDSYPEISNEDLANLVQKILDDLNVEFAEFPSFKSDSIRVDMLTYFSSNPYEFRRLYTEMVEAESETRVPITAPAQLVYSSNLEIAKKQAMSQLISTFRNLRDTNPQKAFLTKYANSSPKQKRAYRDNQPSSEARKYLADNEYLFGDELSGLETYLRNQKDYLSSSLKEMYIESIIKIIKTLKEFNLLDKYLDSHNAQMEAIGLSKLSYTPEEVSAFYDNLSFESLSQFSMAELSVLNSFWVNRLTKEILAFNASFLAIKDLNLWQAIREAPYTTSTDDFSREEDDDSCSAPNMLDIPITDEQIMALKEKARFLSHLADELFKQPYAQSMHQTVEYSTGKLQNLYRPISVLSDQYGEEYSSYFSRVNGGALAQAPNNLYDDLAANIVSSNITLNAYKIKDNLIISQLFTLFNANTFSKNWGLCLDKNQKRLPNKVLIAIDVPGFNMPIRLHMPLELVKDFLKANQRTERMPIYAGTATFNKRTSKGKFSTISTPLLMPITKKRTAHIKQIAATLPAEHKHYNFVQHITSLAERKPIPRYLYESTSKKKDKGRFVTREYDFSTNKVYKVTGQNQSVEDTTYSIGGTIVEK